MCDRNGSVMRACYCSEWAKMHIYYVAKNVMRTEYATAVCRDCKQKACLWRNWSSPFWHKWYPDRFCQHHPSDICVDESKIVIRNLSSRPTEYWAEAPASCNICHTSFTMKSNFNWSINVTHLEKN